MPQSGTAQTRLFGPFRLSLLEQALYVGNRRVALGGRAVDILLALTESPGDLVSKDKLLAKVWPDLHVDEAALRVHISALRKALGPTPSGGQYIANVAGRGYRFVEQVVEPAAHTPLPTAPDGELPLPIDRPRIVGRDAAVQSLVKTIALRRFVTVTGPGGIGKTTLAWAVAGQLGKEYPDGIHFIDLTSLTDAALVSQRVASTLKIHGLSDDTEVNLIASVRDWQTLLVLDNCERLVEPVALLAERILAASPAVHILVTSREPLRALGEWVYRLPPLSVPPIATAFNKPLVLGAQAVSLFLERCEAASEVFAIADEDLADLADICRRLDGIPLAIELAAARVNVLGISVLAKMLSENFDLLAGGRRTAFARQRTLRATLDWSYDLLTEDEQALLCRLSVFRDSFTLKAAEAVAAGRPGGLGVLKGIAALAAKSLLSAIPGPGSVRYRLLETTRTYAWEKLSARDEVITLRQVHATYFRSLLAHAEADLADTPGEAWLERYAHTVADVRIAIDWLLSQGDDHSPGVELTGLASPLWFALGMMDEYRGLAERALALLTGSPTKSLVAEMRLNTWLGAATSNTVGPEPRMVSAYSRALTLAVELDNQEYQLYALWGLASYCYAEGEYEQCLQACKRFSDVADRAGDASADLVRDRIMAASLCLVGRLAEARAFGERALRTPAVPSRSVSKRFHEFDHHMASRLHLPRILWLQGFPDRASSLVFEAVDRARSARYSPSFCFLLTFAAFPLAFWSGDLLAAAKYLELLSNQTAGRLNNYWGGWTRCFTSVMGLGANDGSAAFGRSVAAAVALMPKPAHLDVAATLREELVGPVAVSRASNGVANWCTPEIVRANATSMIRTGAADALLNAEYTLKQSLAIAREQGSLAWELRAATSLARLHQSAGRNADALLVLKPVYAQFTEGFGTADLRSAATLLDAL